MLRSDFLLHLLKYPENECQENIPEAIYEFLKHIGYSKISRHT
ncbi:hypothetical protein ACP70R_047140 [Stipagrostis hirtigluma subsp. patula]